MKARIWIGTFSALAIALIFVVYKLSGTPDAARVFTVDHELAQLKETMLAYKARLGKFPDSEKWMDELVAEGLLERRMLDPWGEYYVFDKRLQVILSYGMDGVEGGVDMNQDRKISLAEP